MPKKLLILSDVPDWAFSKIYFGVKKNTTMFNEVDEAYLFNPTHRRSLPEIQKNYDYILNLNDHFVQAIPQMKIPKEKHILAIRSNSDIKYPIYDNPQNIIPYVSKILVSNNILYDRFKDKYPVVHLWPGGVDTDFFIPKKKPLRLEVRAGVRVGWAGSKNNFGYEFRGLDLIKKACDIVGAEFRPAYREDKWRNEDEMLSYYQNEIDIYIDASQEAGRQNGLLEAGACGLPIISTRVGVGELLIEHGKNGLLFDRTIEDIEGAILSAILHKTMLGKNIRETVLKYWSWKKHTEIFENIMED